MTCQTFNLSCSSLGDFAIYQGASYNSLTLFYRDLDLSSYSPLGQIRNTYNQDGGMILASFNFEPLTFGSVTVDGETFNATTIIPFLTAAETEGIPATLERSNQQAPFLAGLNGYVYDIKLIDSSETVMVARGFVEVIKDVSRL